MIIKSGVVRAMNQRWRALRRENVLKCLLAKGIYLRFAVRGETRWMRLAETQIVRTAPDLRPRKSHDFLYTCLGTFVFAETKSVAAGERREMPFGQ